jgi:1-acyl-sn-glycerol-3-phosphate acyltransferase
VRGRAILVSNHISGLDPVLIQSVCHRLVVWMMAKEYYDIKLLSWIFRQVEAIPVHRSGRDAVATRSAMRALQLQRVLGVFPEGRIEDTGEVLDFQTGAALMAIHTGATVYPVAIVGSQEGKEMGECFLYRQSAIVNFGAPVQFDRGSTSREALDNATRLIRAAVMSLRQECQAVWRQPELL